MPQAHLWLDSEPRGKFFFRLADSKKYLAYGASQWSIHLTTMLPHAGQVQVIALAAYQRQQLLALISHRNT